MTFILGVVCGCRGYPGGGLRLFCLVWDAQFFLIGFDGWSGLVLEVLFELGVIYCTFRPIWTVIGVE